MKKGRLFALLGMIAAAALTRLMPHLPNVAPITTMAIFAGATFRNKSWAFLVPFSAMILSDLFLGFHRLLPLVYGCFALDVALGIAISKHRTFSSIAGVTLAGSLVFFVVTNFGVWWVENLYPKTTQGLMACYVAALPFFRNALLGDLTYAAALFGGFSLAEKTLPAVRESAA